MLPLFISLIFSCFNFIYFLCSNIQEPSQQLASSAALSRSGLGSVESTSSSKPGVTSLTAAATFKPVGATSAIKSPSWQRPNQAGTAEKSLSPCFFSQNWVFHRTFSQNWVMAYVVETHSPLFMVLKDHKK